MIRYGNIQLREINANDTPLIVKWRNSSNIKQNLFTQDDLTEQQHLWWLENKVATGECVQFIIELIEPYRLLGTAFIKNIDKKNRKGEFGMFIGEDAERGKGYGTASAQLTLKYGFDILGLNRIYLSVLSNNVSSIRSCEKVGFRKEGLLRQDYIRDDEKYDVVCMGITADMKL